MACVFLAALTTEHKETLDAENNGSSVSPAASGRTSYGQSWSCMCRPIGCTDND